MSDPRRHDEHPHVHAPGCGHKTVMHEGHVDYLHDGHLHHPHEGQTEEHALSIGRDNPNICTPKHACGSHDGAHRHGPGCGHESVPHGDHLDYVVQGHLHHPCVGHCDDHGRVRVS